MASFDVKDAIFRNIRCHLSLQKMASFAIIAYRDVIPFNIPSSHQGSKIKAKDIIKRQKYRYLVKPTERTV